jgi:hypothetical protein
MEDKELRRGPWSTCREGANGFSKCQRLGTLVCVQLMKKLESVN